MDAEQLIQKIEITSEVAEQENLLQQLTDAVNELILYHFDRLLQILYRIDVDEKELRKLLQQNAQTDAAVIIAHLIIKRQQQKLQTRKQFRQNNDIPEDEKW